MCHVLPPLRGARDRDRLLLALSDGTVTAICSDHQPHETDAKLAPFSESEPGISGLETLLPLTLKLVEQDILELSAAVGLLTCGPARILGIDAGHLGIGASADVLIFDPHEEWEFDRNAMVSRGKNNPFHAWPFKGRVRYTLIGGETAFQRST